MIAGETKKIKVAGRGLKAMIHLSSHCFVSPSNPFAWFVVKNIKANDCYRITLKKVK